MQSLSPRQIQIVLSQAAEECASGIASGDEPFFKKLEWWLADGVFNNEPYGMFRTDSPYCKGDARSVAQFLAQETHHRWDGMATLRDLFNQRVFELLEQWVLGWLKIKSTVPMPSPDEWERVWVCEWEEALFMVNLNPRGEDSAWEEFLDLPLSTLVERWRFHAAQVASARALRAARMVSRQDLESAIIGRVSDELAQCRSNAPDKPVAALLSQMVAEGDVQKLEVAVYVHSPSFTRRVDAQLLAQVQAQFPLPQAWAQDDALPTPIDLDA